RINFLIPAENIGDLMGLASERRGIYVRTEYLSPTRAILVYEMPLSEIIYDLYDKLKSVTHGYGTMDYEFLGYRPADLVRLDVLETEDCRRAAGMKSRRRSDESLEEAPRHRMCERLLPGNACFVYDPPWCRRPACHSRAGGPPAPRGLGSPPLLGCRMPEEP